MGSMMVYAEKPSYDLSLFGMMSYMSVICVSHMCQSYMSVINMSVINMSSDTIWIHLIYQNGVWDGLLFASPQLCFPDPSYPSHGNLGTCFGQPFC